MTDTIMTIKPDETEVDTVNVTFCSNDKKNFSVCGIETGKKKSMDIVNAEVNVEPLFTMVDGKVLRKDDANISSIVSTFSGIQFKNNLLKTDVFEEQKTEPEVQEVKEEEKQEPELEEQKVEEPEVNTVKFEEPEQVSVKENNEDELDKQPIANDNSLVVVPEQNTVVDASNSTEIKLENCPATTITNEEIDKIDCKDRKKYALKLHPDKNAGCKQIADEKMKKLNDKCDKNNDKPNDDNDKPNNPLLLGGRKTRRSIGGKGKHNKSKKVRFNKTKRGKGQNNKKNVTRR